MVITGRSTRCPCASWMAQDSRRMSAMSPSSRYATRRVTDSTAAASEARKCSPSPTPTTIGLPCRAPITRPGSRVEITAIA